MKLAIFIICCIVAVKGNVIPEKVITPDFYVPSDRNPRIVGGTNATIEEVPYQVSLRYCRTTCGHFCGGSIINQDTILTAAHCVDGDLPEWIAVRAGSDLRSQGGQILQVRNIIIHPEYQRSGLYNDVAVLKLSTQLRFSSKVMPIGLPPRGMSFRSGTPLLVSGWGALLWQGSSPERLQKVIVPYVPNDVCGRIYGNIRATSLCAGEEGVDACQGDSGGPLVHNNFVVGIVSGGSYCAFDGYPGTYARTSEFLGFISQAMMM
ncbi:trypsin-like [Chironomus tepperi]|uniref:trypsin-like n=1 Tax=Chironomus tepperi TaxID=113505 RepID=UPI00391FBDC0